MRNAPFRAWQQHRLVTIIRWSLLLVSALFLSFHFLHLSADFPNDSPWNDWSKYTDEGWYSDAAVRHYLFGRWYLPGDFNPAVAMPVWPLIEAFVFRLSGVGLVAARATAVCSFVCMLLFSFLLLRRFDTGGKASKHSLAGPLAIFFFCTSPFFFVFDRMAILEPALAALATGTLLTASYIKPWEEWRSGPGRLRFLLPHLGLGLLLPAMVLTKPTAVALFPALAAMGWYRSGYKLRSFLKMAALPCALAASLWMVYLLVLVKPHYWEDYQYLFSANGYTGFQLQPLATVLANTFADGQWMGGVLYPAFYIAMLLALFARPKFFRNPLVFSSLLWAASYFVFLAYHNNLQPRYYLLEAVPVTLLMSLALSRAWRWAESRSTHRWLTRAGLVAGVLAISVPDILLQLSYVLHPEYTYISAAKEIARVIRSDPRQSKLLLSVSGSDLTLMTGLPSIDDDFGTMDLDERVRQYRPGWYVAWNEIDDDKMDALTPLYHPVRIMALPALDDPDRDQMILYRLDPAVLPKRNRRPHRGTPRPLRTKLGQQPTTTQLQH